MRIIDIILRVSMAQPQKKQKKLSLRDQDPFLEREKLKYSNPLPSREFVMQILTEQYAVSG